jgi:hypothetical protein
VIKIKKSSYPLTINKTNWIYTHKRSIELVHQVFIDGKYAFTDHVRIPLSKLKKLIGSPTRGKEKG